MNTRPTDLFSRKEITSFHGEYDFLSNFYLTPIDFEGILWPSVEHAYQAAKCEDPGERWKFLALTAGQAKRRGKKVEIRGDWKKVRHHVMYNLVWLKFDSNPALAKRLLDTGDACLEEGNTWGDKYWGTVDGEGENVLGRILMAVREEMRQSNVANR